MEEALIQWQEQELSKMESGNNVFDAVMEQSGRIDILFNNAGAIRREDCTVFSEKDWDDVMNLNIKTLFFLTQRVGAQMIEKKIPGKIVNTASLLAFQGGIRTPSYTASKSAVKGLTMTLANEWAKYGINVNAIAPGSIMTDMYAAVPEEVKQAKLAKIPLRRYGDPRETAQLYAFLASDEASYVTAQTITIDGGFN